MSVRIIATLGPSVRLVVFQFHMKNESIPENVPKYSDFHKPTASQLGTGGIRVMEPTVDVLLDSISNSGYQLIDAWHISEEDWNRSVVRFVFCHKEHINPTGLRTEFVAQRDGLLTSFNNLAGKNLWKTMAHLNPFFIASKATSEKVFTLDCNSRKQTMKLVQTNKDKAEEIPLWEEVPVTVFQGGREKVERGIGQGIGPRVLLTDKAPQLKVFCHDVVLVTPEPVQETVSSPVA